MINFLRECLSSEGKISSKRLITLLAFSVMAVAYLGNLFFDLTIDSELNDSMQMIVGIGLGTVASEQFKKKGV